MAELTDILWCHHTFNPWSGCVKVSLGCKFCYADASPPSWRRGAKWGQNEPRILASDGYWDDPLLWSAKAEAAGERRRVFCASMADVMEDRDDLDPWRERLWALIKATPWLDWLLLTKRPEKMVRWAKAHGWPANAWAGTSVENQEQVDIRIPLLLAVEGPEVYFLSMEPLLGEVDLTGYVEGNSIIRASGRLRRGLYPLPPPGKHRRVSWVIVGGESGPNARPMQSFWVRILRDKVTAHGVPFFFKQWGGKDKVAAGRLLDGRTWDEFPAAPFTALRKQQGLFR